MTGNTLHTIDRYYRSCATVVGLDRNEWAVEASEGKYETRLRTMSKCVTGKSLILIGWQPAS